MTSQVLPIFETHGDSATSLSQPFFQGEDFGMWTPEDGLTNFELRPEDVLALGAIYLQRTEGEGLGRLAFDLSLDPNQKSSKPEAASSYCNIYSEVLNGFHGTIIAKMNKPDFGQKQLEALTYQAAYFPAVKKISHLAGLVVSDTSASRSNGLIVPRSTFQGFSIQAREFIMKAKISGDTSQDYLSNLEPHQRKVFEQLVMTQDPATYHVGVIAAASLFPSSMKMHKLVESIIG